MKTLAWGELFSCSKILSLAKKGSKDKMSPFPTAHGCHRENGATRHRESSRQGPLHVTELQHLPLAGPPPTGSQMSGSHVRGSLSYLFCTQCLSLQSPGHQEKTKARLFWLSNEFPLKIKLKSANCNPVHRARNSLSKLTIYFLSK